MKQQYLIWDLPLRIFHWLLVVAIAGAWYTSEQGSELIDIHMLFGYSIMGLVLFRVVWGFIGTKYSKFSQFFPSVKRIKDYLRNNKEGSSNYVAGHNPLGSLAVFAMLALLILQATSGLFIDDDVFSSGPYYGSVSKSIEKVMSFLHHNVFDALSILIGLHILAIVFYRLKKKRNLTKAMITGKSDAESINQSDTILHSKLITALILALLVSLFVYWLVIYNAPEMEFY